MPISEQGYLHWQGQLADGRRPWRPITRLGLRLAFRRKYFKFTLGVSLLPAVVFCFGVYAAETFQNFQVLMGGRRQILSVDPMFFRTYFTSGFLLFMALMLMILAGAGLIADDLKSNSLQLYFARPLRKRDYLFGKLGVVGFFLMLLTLVPGVLFIILKLIFSGSFRFLGQFPWLPFAVIAYSLILIVFFSLATLFVSSLGKNRRFAGILLFLIYIFSDVFFGVFYGLFHRPEFCWLSIKANLQQVGAALFRSPLPYNVPWAVSALILAALAAGAALFLTRRVRSVEVIR